MSYNFQIETDREEDGRWIAEIPDLPGVLAYGASMEDAIRSVEATRIARLGRQGRASKEKPLDPSIDPRSFPARHFHPQVSDVLHDDRRHFLPSCLTGTSLSKSDRSGFSAMTSWFYDCQGR